MNSSHWKLLASDDPETRATDGPAFRHYKSPCRVRVQNDPGKRMPVLFMGGGSKISADKMGHGYY